MILKDLLTSVTKEEMVEYFLNIDTEKKYIDGYCRLYDELMGKEPESSNIKLFLVWQKDYFEDDDLYISVLGLDLADDNYYALDFMSRSRWLGSEIIEKSLNDFGKVVFLCECLTEMSVISFDESDVEEEKQILDERIKQIIDGTVNYLSSEEVFNNLREKHGWVVHEVEIDEETQKKNSKRIDEIKDFNNYKIKEMLGRL